MYILYYSYIIVIFIYLVICMFIYLYMLLATLHNYADVDDFQIVSGFGFCVIFIVGLRSLTECRYVYIYIYI